MKGVVFTEFLEMVEKEFGYETADKIIIEEQLASKGIYTAIGTYHHGEMVQLVVNLSEVTGIGVPLLLNAYGKYLFNSFLKSYPVFFENVNDSFTFLSLVDGYIHVEVNKLYPDAELPRFTTETRDGKMTMLYQSSRKMSDLAVGLIEGCLEHYEEDADIVKENMDEEGEEVLITITRR